eukprot:ANDGO_08074.mRNA.1 hypothetical protein
MSANSSLELVFEGDPVGTAALEFSRAYHSRVSSFLTSNGSHLANPRVSQSRLYFTLKFRRESVPELKLVSKSTKTQLLKQWDAIRVSRSTDSSCFALVALAHIMISDSLLYRFYPQAVSAPTAAESLDANEAKAAKLESVAMDALSLVAKSASMSTFVQDVILLCGFQDPLLLASSSAVSSPPSEPKSSSSSACSSAASLVYNAAVSCYSQNDFASVLRLCESIVCESAHAQDLVRKLSSRMPWIVYRTLCEWSCMFEIELAGHSGDGGASNAAVRFAPRLLQFVHARCVPALLADLVPASNDDDSSQQMESAYWCTVLAQTFFESPAPSTPKIIDKDVFAKSLTQLHRYSLGMMDRANGDACSELCISHSTLTVALDALPYVEFTSVFAPFICGLYAFLTCCDDLDLIEHASSLVIQALESFSPQRSMESAVICKFRALQRDASEARKVWRKMQALKGASSSQEVIEIEAALQQGTERARRSWKRKSKAKAKTRMKTKGSSRTRLSRALAVDIDEEEEATAEEEKVERASDLSVDEGTGASSCDMPRIPKEVLNFALCSYPVMEIRHVVKHHLESSLFLGADEYDDSDVAPKFEGLLYRMHLLQKHSKPENDGSVTEERRVPLSFALLSQVLLKLSEIVSDAISNARALVSNRQQWWEARLRNEQCLQEWIEACSADFGVPLDLVDSATKEGMRSGSKARGSKSKTEDIASVPTLCLSVDPVLECVPWESIFPSSVRIIRLPNAHRTGPVLLSASGAHANANVMSSASTGSVDSGDWGAVVLNPGGDLQNTEARIKTVLAECSCPSWITLMVGSKRKDSEAGSDPVPQSDPSSSPSPSPSPSQTPTPTPSSNPRAWLFCGHGTGPLVPSSLFPSSSETSLVNQLSSLSLHSGVQDSSPALEIAMLMGCSSVALFPLSPESMRIQLAVHFAYVSSIKGKFGSHFGHWHASLQSNMTAASTSASRTPEEQPLVPPSSKSRASSRSKATTRSADRSEGHDSDTRSVLIVGNGWDVTDKDLDSWTAVLLKQYERVVAENDKALDMLDAPMTARQVSRLPCLTAAAARMYAVSISQPRESQRAKGWTGMN